MHYPRSAKDLYISEVNTFIISDLPEIVSPSDKDSVFIGQIASDAHSTMHDIFNPVIF